MEDVCVEKLEDHDSHLLIASPTDSSHGAEPLFVFQFLSGDSLDHVQELLCDEALEFAKGLLFKNRSYLLLFFRCALAQNQLSNFLEQRCRRGPEKPFSPPHGPGPGPPRQPSAPHPLRPPPPSCRVC